MSSYVFIIFNDIAVHDGKDTLGCATLWKGVNLSERSLAGVDLLQVPLEDTQHKFKIVGMNSDADV